MQVELPRYIWADTRFKKDPENPLLYRAFTKSYDPDMHIVSPYRADIDFGSSGINLRTARAVIAMSEVSMLTLQNLTAIAGAGAETAKLSGIRRTDQNLSGFLSEVLDAQPEDLFELGEIGGMGNMEPLLTLALVTPFIKPSYRNAVKILDAHSEAGPEGPEIADAFVGFYQTARRTILTKAERLSPKIDLSKYPNEDRGADTLSEEAKELVRELLVSEDVAEGRRVMYSGLNVDQGFLTVLRRLEVFVNTLSQAKPDWIFHETSKINSSLAWSLWYTYYSEVASGIAFLNEREVKINHGKNLTHEHFVSEVPELAPSECKVVTGDSDIQNLCLVTEIADVEKLYRCPFFTERGWIDTYLRISIID